MFGTQKGITPVIAIVLLLLVTVGAVGVVYTQFQSLVGDGPEADFLDAQNIDIGFQTTTRNESWVLTPSGDDFNTIQIGLENSGETEYNMTDEMRLEYSVPGEDRVQTGVVSSAFDAVDYRDGPHTCFDNSDMTNVSQDWETFGPGDEVSCNTGVSMPSPDDEVEIHLVLEGSGDEITSYTCSPSTSDSTTC
ncbi:MAG: hypothetical protein R6V35_05435 [Candidatus Nanohaloarchaea archaeon]